MNLILQNKIKDVISFKIEKNLLFYQNKNYELKSNLFKTPPLMYECFYIHQKWFFNGLNNSLYILENDILTKLTDSKPITLIDKKHQKALLSYDTSVHSYKRTLFDLNQLKECTQNSDYYEITVDFLNNIHLYYCSTKRHLLNSVNLNTNQVVSINDISDIGIWRRQTHSVTYREEYAIRRAIAVVNDVLWLDISKGVIMGIDIQTGKTLHVFKEKDAEIIKMEGKNTETKQYDFYHQTDLPEHPHTFYDEVTQKLFGVHNHQYYEVDLQDPKLQIYDLIDEYALYGDITPFKQETSLVQLKAWATRSCFDDTHIYFIVDNASKAQIAALNRQTLKIEWVYEFDDSGILMQIQVSSNNLYVLDNQATLHIFEKQDVNSQ